MLNETYFWVVLESWALWKSEANFLISSQVAAMFLFSIDAYNGTKTPWIPAAPQIMQKYKQQFPHVQILVPMMSLYSVVIYWFYPVRKELIFRSIKSCLVIGQFPNKIEDKSQCLFYKMYKLWMLYHWSLYSFSIT